MEHPFVRAVQQERALLAPVGDPTRVLAAEVGADGLARAEAAADAGLIEIAARVVLDDEGPAREIQR